MGCNHYQKVAAAPAPIFQTPTRSSATSTKTTAALCGNATPLARAFLRQKEERQKRERMAASRLTTLLPARCLFCIGATLPKPVQKRAFLCLGWTAHGQAKHRRFPYSATNSPKTETRIHPAVALFQPAGRSRFPAGVFLIRTMGFS